MANKTLEKGKTFYKKWKPRDTYSPALAQNIKISNKGWNHIVTHRRNNKDMYKRVRLLPYAKS